MLVWNSILRLLKFSNFYKFYENIYISIKLLLQRTNSSYCKDGNNLMSSIKPSSIPMLLDNSFSLKFKIKIFNYGIDFKFYTKFFKQFGSLLNSFYHKFKFKLFKFIKYLNPLNIYVEYCPPSYPKLFENKLKFKESKKYIF